MCLALFGLLALLAAAAPGTLTAADRALGRAPYRLAGDHPWLERAAAWVETATHPDHLVLAGLVAGLVFAAAGALRRAVLVAYVPLAADTAYPLFKDLFERPRPEHVDPLHTIGGWSFPSGHATVGGATVWVAMVLVVSLVVDPVRRRRLLAGLTVVALALGFDRLLLGVHYFSDVVAGFLLAGAITLGAAAALDPFTRAAPAVRWAVGTGPEVVPGR